MRNLAYERWESINGRVAFGLHAKTRRISLADLRATVRAKPWLIYRARGDDSMARTRP